MAQGITCCDEDGSLVGNLCISQSAVAVVLELGSLQLGEEAVLIGHAVLQVVSSTCLCSKLGLPEGICALVCLCAGRLPLQGVQASCLAGVLDEHLHGPEKKFSLSILDISSS